MSNNFIDGSVVDMFRILIVICSGEFAEEDWINVILQHDEYDDEGRNAIDIDEMLSVLLQKDNNWAKNKEYKIDCIYFLYLGLN